MTRPAKYRRRLRRSEMPGEHVPFLKLLRPYAQLFFDEENLHYPLLRLLLCLFSVDERRAVIDRVAPPAKSRRVPWFRDVESQNMLGESLREEAEDSDNLANELRGRSSRITDVKRYRDTLRKALCEQQASVQARPKAHPVEARIARFCHSMKLDEGEQAVLTAAYLESEVAAFQSALGEFEGSRRIDFISRGSGVARPLVMKALSSQSTLRSCEFIDSRPMTGNLMLSEDVRLFLETGDEDSLVSASCHEPVGEALPLSAFTEPVFGLADCLEACQGLLGSKGPSHILFFGEPGVGKTQLARALAKRSGLHARFVREEDSADNRSRVARIEIASRMVDPSRDLLVIDEADGVLNTRGGVGLFFLGGGGGRDRDKGRLNAFLDRCPAKTLWILNESGSLSDAVCRRFHYSWEFRPLGASQRRAVWQRLLVGHPKAVLIRPHVDALADRYPIDIGGVKNALATVHRLSRGEDAPALVRRLEHLLDRHHHLFRGKAPAPRARGDRYDAKLLNTDLPVEAVTSALEAFSATWASGKLEEGANLNLLFWGPPGTGKTAFARHLARELGRDLIVKRASDLQNPYVGMTERLIRDAFRDAAASRSILLIDEADSFLGDRRGHQRSWETTEVNEFLTQMECHTGVLICSTNLLDRLDPASKRRFAFKVNFRPLSPEARESVVKLYFPALAPGLTNQDSLRLRELDGLTPGDVNAVAAQARHLAPGDPTPEWVLERLKNEVRYRADEAAKIGFGR